MCRLSWNLGASTSWNPQGLSRPVMGLFYLFNHSSVCVLYHVSRMQKKPRFILLLTRITSFHLCLRAIWHMHGSMWRATRMTRDRKRIIVAHCYIALWRHYYYGLAKFYCRGRVEGHFSGYPSHKTYTCQLVILLSYGFLKAVTTNNLGCMVCSGDEQIKKNGD